MQKVYKHIPHVLYYILWKTTTHITQLLTRALKGANISGLLATSSGGKPPNCSQLPKHSNIYEIKEHKSTLV